MSSLSQFTNKQNLKLLWDVLLDELNINKTNTKLIGNIRTVFESNINPFSSRANPKLQIIELNKQFLSQVVLAVNRLFPTLKQDQNIKRITISDEEVSEPYRIEDIHASRQSEFEKDVERKRMEMENYMTPQKPRELDFSDKTSDGKIKAMDSLVADKMAQRNMEIEQFQNSSYNSSIDPEKWLTPKETSVKNEKTVIEPKVAMLEPKVAMLEPKVAMLEPKVAMLEPKVAMLEPKVIEQKPIIKNNQNSKLKYISIDSDNNITLSIDEIEPKHKKVSWDDSHIMDEQKESTMSIFNKLKKQPVEPPIQEITNEANNKQYIEQKSAPLPQVKREEIQRNQVTLPTPINEPVIPKTEIIRQLNEMNNKIDNLYELVFKLTNLMEKNNNTEIPEVNDMSN
jgi:hypothetical protein